MLLPFDETQGGLSEIEGLQGPAHHSYNGDRDDKAVETPGGGCTKPGLIFLVADPENSNRVSWTPYLRVLVRRR